MRPYSRLLLGTNNAGSKRHWRRRRAQEVFEKLGVPDSLGRRRDLLRAIELEVRSQSTSGAPDSSGELLEMRLFPTPAGFPPFVCGNPPSPVANKFPNH